MGDTIELREVQSSLIKRIGHDAERKLLRVEFNDGATWDYADVTAEQFHGLSTAGSVGGHFLAYIKPRHQGTKVTAAA